MIFFSEPPSPELAEALAAFERSFTYPLGPGRSFRIEHGPDYARFYRAQGEARCFARVEEGRVLGVLCVALRPVLLPDGSAEQAAYIGDVKLAAEARCGTTLHRLARAAMEWAAPRCRSAYGVVMDGTSVVPDSYTGRAGIPAFNVLGKLMIYRLSIPGDPSWWVAGTNSREEAVRACFHQLGAGRIACPPGRPNQRSTIEPVWLMLPDGTACGCLEDTRRAKRLIADDGQEMVSAHLSCFAFRNPSAGVRLLLAALTRTAMLGYPALFAAVDQSDAAAFDAEIPSTVEVVRAPATVFGHQLPAGAWLLATSEI
jgi:hypothetical protein